MTGTIVIEGVRAAVYVQGSILAAISLLPVQEEKPPSPAIGIEKYALDPTRPRVAVAAADHFVYVVWFEGDRPTLTLPYAGKLDSFSFSPDAAHLATSSSDGKAQVFELEHGTLVASFDAYPGGGGSFWSGSWASWSNDGKRILTCGEDKYAVLWDLSTKARVRSLGDDADIVHHAIWSADSKVIATASERGIVRLWDGTTGEPLSEPIGLPAFMQAEASSHPIAEIAFHPDGRRLAVSCSDARARIVDMKTGSIELTVSHKDNDWSGDLALCGVQFSRDGAHLLTTTFGWHEVCSWETRTGREEWRSDFGGGNEGGIGAEYSPDEREVFVNRNARWIDAKSGEMKRQLPDSCLVYYRLSADGRFVASIESGDLILRDSRSLKERYRVSRGPGANATVRQAPPEKESGR